MNSHRRHRGTWSEQETEILVVPCSGLGNSFNASEVQFLFFTGVGVGVGVGVGMGMGGRNW